MPDTQHAKHMGPNPSLVHKRTDRKCPVTVSKLGSLTQHALSIVIALNPGSVLLPVSPHCSQFMRSQQHRCGSALGDLADITVLTHFHDHLRTALEQLQQSCTCSQAGHAHSAGMMECSPAMMAETTMDPPTACWLAHHKYPCACGIASHGILTTSLSKLIQHQRWCRCHGCRCHAYLGCIWVSWVDVVVLKAIALYGHIMGTARQLHQV